VNSLIACRGRLALPVLLFIIFLLVTPQGVIAQGNGNGKALGHQKTRPTGPSSAGSAAAGADLPAGTGMRNFGSWLDDASMLPEGMGFFSVGFGFYKSPAYSEFDMPVIDGAVALHKRVQFGASVPFYHVGAAGGPVSRGMGDVYLTTKVQVREATEKHLGFAVTPIVEVLSTAPVIGGGRLAWALPVNIELRRSSWRAFGSAGYFSRKSLFASGALEATLSERVSVTGSVSRSHSMQADPLSVALGLAQSRTDVTGAAAVQVGPTMSVFGAVGRTISKQDANSASLTLSGGLSLAFVGWK
jgi:hypothetical protein